MYSLFKRVFNFFYSLSNAVAAVEYVLLASTQPTLASAGPSMLLLFLLLLSFIKQKVCS